MTEEKRPRGRPPLPDEEKLVGRTVHLPRKLWEKVDVAGGAKWLRQLIKRAKVPTEKQ